MTDLPDGGAIAIVYALFGSEEAAIAAARDAVEQRLAACANVQSSCRSVYRWDGAMCEEREWSALFKTTVAHRAGLMARIASGHDYDIPAILSWSADAVNPDYADWVHGATGPVRGVVS